MISIHIEGMSAREVQQEMIQLLAGASLAQGGAASGETQTTTTSTGRGRGKKTTEPAAGGEAGNAGTSSEGATSSTGQSSAADDGPITKETLSPRVMQLGTKAGPAAVTELFGEFGAKKFSEIAEDKYAALSARLDELLAA